MLTDQRVVLAIKKRYKPGMKIRLISMKGETQMPEGLLGTVTIVDDAGQIHCQWENGSSLALIPDEDHFTIV